MNSKKLTLLVPGSVVKMAKAYAKAHGTSISSLVTGLFEQLQSASSEGSLSESPITRSSSGLLKLPKGKKSDLLADALWDKYK